MVGNSFLNAFFSTQVVAEPKMTNSISLLKRFD